MKPTVQEKSDEASDRSVKSPNKLPSAVKDLDQLTEDIWVLGHFILVHECCQQKRNSSKSPKLLRQGIRWRHSATLKFHWSVQDILKALSDIEMISSTIYLPVLNPQFKVDYQCQNHLFSYAISQQPWSNQPISLWHKDWKSLLQHDARQQGLAIIL